MFYAITSMPMDHSTNLNHIYVFMVATFQTVRIKKIKKNIMNFGGKKSYLSHQLRKHVSCTFFKISNFAITALKDSP